VFQAADKQSAKRISSRAGFETHCNSAGETAFWPGSQPRESGLGGTQHLRAGAGRKMLSPDTRGYFQTIGKQQVVLQIGQTALVARATEDLPARAAVCMFSAPCPPFPGFSPIHVPPAASSLLWLGISFAGSGSIARQKISFQIILLRGTDLSSFLTLFNCLCFPPAGGNWITVIFNSFLERTGTVGTFLEVHRKETSMYFCFRRLNLFQQSHADLH